MAEVKLTHTQLERFVSETLSKREPCPAMVLAWGWLLKQGEGGFFHNDSFKQRYFVLARVPHATVLIYYAEKTMDEEHILGYIDLRRVTAVQEGSKPVAMDGAKPAASGGFMSRMFSRSASSAAATPSEGARATVELVTTGRVYVLVPCSILMPPPMTTSAALSASDGSKPLYLFGWPFPVPPLDTTDDSEEVAAAVSSGMLSPDSFAQWRDVLSTAVAAERATRVYPVMVLVDSTGQLPQRVLLRTTPCELAIISVDDKDLCFAAVPYNDLIKWEVHAESEVHITARTRSRLVAKHDRSGFSAQRPTRPTCHYVFKSQASAKQIIHVIDNHLRELAKQLGEGTGADATEVAATGEEVSADAPEDGAEQKKLVSHKPSEEGESSGSEEARPSTRATASAKKPAKRAAASSDESEEEPKPKPRKSASKKKAASDDEEESEDEPKPRSRKPKKKAESDDDDESDEAPKKSTKKAAKKRVEESDDDDDAPRKSRKSTTSKKKVVESDDEESDEAPAKPRKSASKPKKKAAVSDDDDDDE